MSAFVRAAFVVLLSFEALAWAGSEPASEDKELIELQSRWASARKNRDVAFLESFYAPDFRVTAMSGSMYGRTEDIAMFSSGDLRPEIIENDDMRVSVYGDAALVTGRERLKGSYRGRTGNSLCGSPICTSNGTGVGSSLTTMRLRYGPSSRPLVKRRSETPRCGHRAD